MVEVKCDEASEGFRGSERLVSLRDAVSSRRSFLRVESDFLSRDNGHYYLPVGVVQQQTDRGLVLIELPHDTDMGPRRLVVRAADLKNDGRADG